MMNAAMANTLYQLYTVDNKYDGEYKKKPAQASSTNDNKKVRLKSTLKKSKQVWRRLLEYAVSISYFSLKER